VISTNSYCNKVDASRECTVPCTPDVGCYICQCLPDLHKDTSLVGTGYTCQNKTTDSSEKFIAFSKCLRQNIDPYFKVVIEDYIQQEVGFDPDEPFDKNFEEYLMVEACVTPEGTSWPNPNNQKFTKDTCEALNGWCRHRNCNLDIGDTVCNERCFIDIPFGGGICSIPFNEFSHSPINRPSLCELRLTDTLLPTNNQTLCEQIQGTFIGPPITSTVKIAPCLKVFGNPHGEASMTEYYNNPGCNPNLQQGSPCPSYCYDDTITQNNCAGLTSGGLSRVWTTWTDSSNQPHSLCLLVNTTGTVGLVQCGQEGQWFQGLNWIPAIVNTEAECSPGTCYELGPNALQTQIPLDLCLQFRCNTCQTGNETQCFNDTLCKTTRGLTI